VDPRAGLDDLEKRLKLRPQGRPAGSQSLHRLHYPGSHPATIKTIKYFNFELIIYTESQSFSFLNKLI
jgi:hypothetical protein